MYEISRGSAGMPPKKIWIIGILRCNLVDFQGLNEEYFNT